ncbi:MAG TPA: TetR/AcrR family transcriptional regulator [Microbacteriaceae bacterium]|nr:TetR/AcrR family transcriptional regulator [Microbacteriaceae bacterium]
MPKVSDAHRESRRDQILDAALHCFTAQGFQTTTMADIIAASGLSAGAIYGYFPGKQELAIAAARRAIAGRVEDVAAAASGGPIAPAAVLRAVAEGFERDGIAFSLVVQLWGEAASDPDFRSVVTSAFADLAGTFGAQFTAWARAERGMSEAEADEWSRQALPILLALGQGLIVQSALLPGFDRERYLAAVERFLG